MSDDDFMLSAKEYARKKRKEDYQKYKVHQRQERQKLKSEKDQ